jgi:hypothetical protein
MACAVAVGTIRRLLSCRSQVQLVPTRENAAHQPSLSIRAKAVRHERLRLASHSGSQFLRSPQRVDLALLAYEERRTIAFLCKQGVRRLRSPN